jgi:hypothetical protein
MKTPRGKYNNDPQFKALVSMMLSYIFSADFTPSEMRQAAILASIMYEERRIRTHNFIIPEVEDALETLTNFTETNPTI